MAVVQERHESARQKAGPGQLSGSDQICRPGSMVPGREPAPKPERESSCEPGPEPDHEPECEPDRESDRTGGEQVQGSVCVPAACRRCSVLAPGWSPRPWQQQVNDPDRELEHDLGHEPERAPGHDTAAIRRSLRRRGIAATIFERADQQAGRARRGSRGGRPPLIDPAVYQRCNVVERCIGRLKQWRGIATGFDKPARHYQAVIVLVTALLWINT
ncbi:hypothetical protein [Actinomadura verrucosospora]